MSVYNYSRYKVLIDPKSKKTQGLRLGDVVRRQYFDYPNLIYSLMIVLETGIDVIAGEESAYFIGALIEGNEPKSGELLDFIRVTNLFDSDRGGALYLTASDSEAPYMDVIDGLAHENSLCYPVMAAGDPLTPSVDKYAIEGQKYVSIIYKQWEQEASRILRLTRNTIANVTDTIGLKQSIYHRLENPQRVIVSYKIRASKNINNIPVKFGYTDGSKFDGTDKISIDTIWKYKLHLITIDYPPTYQRSFSIELSSLLNNNNDWCEVADLNIVLQSDISNFTNATKARIGKIRGVIDPVFGVLDGYGAYFQNLYATKNVNIAGTLTAGDENGFSSTFYVGKIHKNVISNSIDCTFIGGSAVVVSDQTPVGIGKSWNIGFGTKLEVQTKEWRNEHLGKKYCFSIWVKADKNTTLSIYQDEHFLMNILVLSDNNWTRIHVPFLIEHSNSTNMTVTFRHTLSGIKITAPQLEAGSSPSQYQPTDGMLSYVEDYGAWFSKGGIGGTIQNPLLKLNEDGSISSRDNTFIINPDGTGQFASGRFKWTKKTITLQDVTIRWEDLDEVTKENMLPVSVEIFCPKGFTIKNNANNIDATALVFRGGDELDKAGTEFSYTWKLWNAMGTTVVKTYTGKSIIVTKNDVMDQGALVCEVTAI